MERLKNKFNDGLWSSPEHAHIVKKINEIVDWLNKHEKNPPYVRPTVYGQS